MENHNSNIVQIPTHVPDSPMNAPEIPESNEFGKKELIDPELPVLQDDPRILNPEDKGKAQKKRGAGRNTESFDPKSTLVRPAMRIVVGPNRPRLDKQIKHDDVIIVPEFFWKEDDWSMYYNLIKEMREVQAEGSDKKADWISWHEGAHLISHAPQGCPMFQDIQDKLAGYFDIAQQSVGTRFNWYKDSSDWKPFHHDSAAFNPQRARNQNITVGVSFGATRELAFLSAATGEKIYFPQVNGMLFAFGRDVNIKWKHGVNALPQEEHDGKGRISIILWGLVPDVKEEDNSPPILTDNTRGNGYTMHRDRAPLERRDNYRRRSRSPRDRYRDNRRDRDHGRGGRPHCKFGNDCRDRQHGRCNRQHPSERDDRQHSRSRSRSRS